MDESLEGGQLGGEEGGETGQDIIYEEIINQEKKFRWAFPLQII